MGHVRVYMHTLTDKGLRALATEYGITLVDLLNDLGKWALLEEDDFRRYLEQECGYESVEEEEEEEEEDEEDEEEGD